MIGWLDGLLTDSLKAVSQLVLAGLLMGPAWAQSQVPQQHETLVVTGTYDPIPLEESDRDVDVEGIPLSRTLLANTLIDFLKLDSSIDLQERAPDGIQTDISIRGTNFGQTLILLNGVRVSDVQTGHYSMDLPIPLEGVDRIEVLKGAGSTMYGSDAVGGAINIVTRIPEADDFSVRLAAGNFGTHEERADGTFVLGPWAQSVWFSHDFSDGFTYDRDYRDLQFGSGTHLRDPFGITDLTLGFSDRPYGADQFYGNFNSFEHTKVWFAGLHRTFGEQTEADIGYRRHSDLFVLLRDNPEYFTNRHIDDTFQAALRRFEKLGLNTRFHYGAELVHDGIDSNNLGQHTRNRGAVFVSLDVRALKRFSFSLGVREEAFGGGQSDFSPSASAGYWLTTKLRLHASLSHAFRLPSFTDLYYHDPGNLGNPNLKPEKAWDYEGGADWDFSRYFRAAVNVFELRERDVIDYVRSDPNAIYVATNFDRLNYTGAEFLVKYYGFKVSYTILHGAFNGSQVVESKYTAYYPSHEATASWEGSVKGGLTLRTRIGAMQRYNANPYGLWDFYAAYSRSRLHPFLQLTNITNTVYQEVAGVAMPKRAILGGIEFRLRDR
jgi:iron complex outermembrane receptor protein